jgi:hypothetical protein
MKLLIRAAVAAGTLAAGAGLWASSASGAPAVTFPAQTLPIIYPSPSPDGTLPPADSGIAKISGLADCPAFLFGDPQGAVGFKFLSGNAVANRIPDGNPADALNDNAEGIAVLVDNSTLTGYVGQTHLWLGINLNPTGNSQMKFGETIAFHGTAPDGSTVSITANPGSTTSASGNTNGWGQLHVICTAPA